ncbi:MAG: hypothetical protein QNL05_12055 [Gammaproteobacteria bacterium]|nr:hypothetical protein [Gammaproteobacteria bacterium]
MGDFATSMGTKNPGDLILHDDWNKVIEEIDSNTSDITAIEETVETNQTSIEGLTERIATAESQLGSLLSAIDTLRNRFRRVTLHTERSKFAFGEAGEITATLTALDGSTLDLGSTSDRPWIDFVTVWGKLQAASGFTSVGGEGDRTISVQVNSEGIARVQLKAESSLGVTEEGETSASAIMQTVTSNGLSIATNLLAASTPQDTVLQESYQIISQVYDNSPNMHFTHYADNYYQQMQWGVIQPAIVLPNWFSQDYRTSVMAFVKGDNNPLTAEPNLGTTTIQVTFRDWLLPWIITDYQPGYINFIDTYQPILLGAIDSDYTLSSNRIKDHVAEIIKGKGKLGQQRDFRALEATMGGINMSNPPKFLPEMMQQLQGSIRLQKTISLITETGNTDALSLLAGMDVKSEGGRESFQQNMETFVNDKMSDARNEINAEVRITQQQLRDEIFSDSSTNSFNVLRSRVDSMDNVITGLQQLDSDKINLELIKVEGLNQRLLRLEN